MEPGGSGLQGTGGPVAPPEWRGDAVVLVTPLLPVPAPRRLVQAARALLAIALVLAGASLLATPARTSTGDLHLGLQRGSVDWVVIEEAPDSDEPVTGVQAASVTWSTGWGRELTAFLPSYDDGDGRSDWDATDDIRSAVERSPGDVDLTTVPAGSRPTPTTSWPFTVAAAVGGLGAFLYLVAGPAPRVATRWAWFWLATGSPVLWLVMVVAEPVPLWFGVDRAAAPRRRLTGGPAFVFSLVAGTLIGWFLPEWRGLLFRA